MLVTVYVTATKSGYVSIEAESLNDALNQMEDADIASMDVDYLTVDYDWEIDESQFETEDEGEPINVFGNNFYGGLHGVMK